MNVLLVLVISLLAFGLGYRFYARRVERAFEADGTHVMPSVELKDDVDYVPTRKFVLFGHHFASIAGGGPIIGPTVALVFGWVPVWLWLVLGTVFIGVVHDFSALLASVREKGRSMAEVAEHTFGRTGFLSFVGFTIVMLLMLTSVFLTLTTTALSSMYPASFFGEMASHVRTVQVNGVEHAVIGGIASTSVIFITLCAPLLGWLLYRRNLNAYVAGLLATAVCGVSVWVGLLCRSRSPPLAGWSSCPSTRSSRPGSRSGSCSSRATSRTRSCSTGGSSRSSPRPSSSAPGG